MTYYKGNIIVDENIFDKEKEYKYGFVNSERHIVNDDSLNINILNSEEKQDLTAFNEKLYFELIYNKELVFNAETNPLIYKIFNKLVPHYDTHYSKLDVIKTIIFEIIKDSYGNKYGKELITGLVFPIYTDVNNYSFIKRIDKNDLRDWIYIKNKKNLKIFETFDKQKLFIGSAKIADNNEVKEYLEQFDKGLFKQKKKSKFINVLDFYSIQEFYLFYKDMNGKMHKELKSNVRVRVEVEN